MDGGVRWLKKLERRPLREVDRAWVSDGGSRAGVDGKRALADPGVVDVVDRDTTATAPTTGVILQNIGSAICGHRPRPGQSIGLDKDRSP